MGLHVIAALRTKPNRRMEHVQPTTVSPCQDTAYTVHIINIESPFRCTANAIWTKKILRWTIMRWQWQDKPFVATPLPVLFLRSPLRTLIKVTHEALSGLRGTPKVQGPAINVVCISDTHAKTKKIPLGDLLIHAGDFTNAGTPKDIQAQIDWLNSLPHKHKVCIAGNHDTWLDPRARRFLSLADAEVEDLDWGSVIYLQHSSVSLRFPSHGGRTLTVYGAPQIPACGGSDFAFQYAPGADAWTDTVPNDTDILVTHTPPAFHRDIPTGPGCDFLLNEIWRAKPILHVCGHVHAGSGKEVLFWDEAQRAYESSCRWKGSLMSELGDLGLWLNLVFVLFYGVIGILWSSVWGGGQDSTQLVNSSLTYRNTSQLRNEPQVVRI